MQCVRGRVPIAASGEKCSQESNSAGNNKMGNLSHFIEEAASKPYFSGDIDNEEKRLRTLCAALFRLLPDYINNSSFFHVRRVPDVLDTKQQIITYNPGFESNAAILSAAKKCIQPNVRLNDADCMQIAYYQLVYLMELMRITVCHPAGEGILVSLRNRAVYLDEICRHQSDIKRHISNTLMESIRLAVGGILKDPLNKNAAQRILECSKRIQEHLKQLEGHREVEILRKNTGLAGGRTTKLLYECLLIPNFPEERYPFENMEEVSNYIEKIERKCSCRLYLTKCIPKCFVPDYIMVEIAYDPYAGNPIGIQDLFTYLVNTVKPGRYFIQRHGSVSIDEQGYYYMRLLDQPHVRHTGNASGKSQRVSGLRDERKKEILTKEADARAKRSSQTSQRSANKGISEERLRHISETRELYKSRNKDKSVSSKQRGKQVASPGRSPPNQRKEAKTPKKVQKQGGGDKKAETVGKQSKSSSSKRKNDNEHEARTNDSTPTPSPKDGKDEHSMDTNEDKVLQMMPPVEVRPLRHAESVADSLHGDSDKVKVVTNAVEGRSLVSHVSTCDEIDFNGVREEYVKGCTPMVQTVTSQADGFDDLKDTRAETLVRSCSEVDAGEAYFTTVEDIVHHFYNASETLEWKPDDAVIEDSKQTRKSRSSMRNSKNTKSHNQEDNRLSPQSHESGGKGRHSGRLSNRSEGRGGGSGRLSSTSQGHGRNSGRLSSRINNHDENSRNSLTGSPGRGRSDRLSNRSSDNGRKSNRLSNRRADAGRRSDRLSSRSPSNGQRSDRLSSRSPSNGRRSNRSSNRRSGRHSKRPGDQAEDKNVPETRDYERLSNRSYSSPEEDLIVPETRDRERLSNKSYDSPPKAPVKADHYRRCHDHLRIHKGNLPTPNLQQTLAAVCTNGDNEMARKLEKDLKKEKSISNLQAKNFSQGRVTSTFTNQKTVDHQDRMNKEGVKCINQLIYQVAFDCYLLSGSTDSTSFQRSLFMEHSSQLLSAIPRMSDGLTKRWNKKALTERLRQAQVGIHLPATPKTLDEYDALSTDLMGLVENLSRAKLGTPWKSQPNHGMRTLYHSFFVPGIEDFKEPFREKSKSDRRIHRAEITCHCRINLSRDAPSCMPLNYIFVEVYYDFVFGNHIGAMDMIQRTLFHATTEPKIPNRDYRTILCYPTGEKLVFQDVRWMMETTPLRRPKKGPCPKLLQWCKAANKMETAKWNSTFRRIDEQMQIVKYPTFAFRDRERYSPTPSEF